MIIAERIFIYLIPILFVVLVGILVGAFIEQEKYRKQIKEGEIVKVDNAKKNAGWIALGVTLPLFILYILLSRFVLSRNVFQFAEILTKLKGGAIQNRIYNYLRILLLYKELPPESQISILKSSAIDISKDGDIISSEYLDLNTNPTYNPNRET